MRALAVLAWAPLAAAWWPLAARAEPRFAVREGMQCAACHVNQSGGGMRGAYGVAFAQTSLPSRQLRGAFLPMLGDSVAAGANLRVEDQLRFGTTTELDGTTFQATGSHSFEMPEGNLYLRLEPVAERLLVYLDETVAPEGAAAREAFVMAKSRGGLYVKGGRFMLPYGLRIPDDQAFIRQATGYTYAAQDLGLELGWATAPLWAAVAISNGSGGGADPNLAKQVTASAVAVGSWARGGASFSFEDSSDEDFTYRTWTSGVHGGLRLGRLYGLAEIDWIHGLSGEDTYDQVPFYLEADFEALQGLYARFVFGAFDPLIQMAEDERDRFVFGLSWFPIQVLELRAEYRLNRDIPQRVDGNVDELRLQLHGFL